MTNRLTQASCLTALLAAGFTLNACGSNGSSAPTVGGIRQLTSASRATSGSRFAKAHIYVSDGLRARPHARVLSFAADANGDVAPLARIKGPKTGILRPYGVAVDAMRNVYVVNFADGESGRESITVYAAGAHGDATPIQSISGSNTQIYIPDGIAVDDAENIYVVNNVGPSSKGSVTVYAAGASGNVAPMQEIAGSNPGIVNTSSIAVDAERNIYVTSIDGIGGIVWVFAAGSNGNVAPIQTITGAKTQLNSPSGVTVDPQGFIYVVNANSTFQGPSSVTVYAPGANGNVARSAQSRDRIPAWSIRSASLWMPTSTSTSPAMCPPRLQCSPRERTETSRPSGRFLAPTPHYRFLTASQCGNARRKASRSVRNRRRDRRRAAGGAERRAIFAG
jgi:hypothetical protein